jgi:hypothetical protein
MALCGVLAATAMPWGIHPKKNILLCCLSFRFLQGLTGRPRLRKNERPHALPGVYIVEKRPHSSTLPSTIARF